MYLASLDCQSKSTLEMKSKHQMNQRYWKKKKHVDKSFDEVTKDQRMTGNREKYDVHVPENILSPSRGEELEILICFRSKNRRRNAAFCNGNSEIMSKYIVVINMYKSRVVSRFVSFKSDRQFELLVRDEICLNIRVWLKVSRTYHVWCLSREIYSTYKLSCFRCIRGFMLEKAKNEATINHLQRDLAAHKSHMHVLASRLDHLQLDVESKCEVLNKSFCFYLC